MIGGLMGWRTNSAVVSEGLRQFFGVEVSHRGIWLSVFSNSPYSRAMGVKADGRCTVTSFEDLEELLDLSKFLDQVTEPAALLGADDQTVPLPFEAFELLRNIVEIMRQGKAVTIAPVDQRLTTQEAADFLGMSRPTFVKLLEEGQLPFTRTPGGRHRRVLLSDVVAYQEQMSVNRRKALDELTAEAYESGFYEDLPEKYLEVLKHVRKELHSG